MRVSKVTYDGVYSRLEDFYEVYSIEMSPSRQQRRYTYVKPGGTVSGHVSRNRPDGERCTPYAVDRPGKDTTPSVSSLLSE